MIEPHWKEWVGECLMSYVAEDTIRQTLLSNDKNASEVETLLTEAKNDPYIAAGRKISKQYRMVHWLLNTYEITRSKSEKYGQIERLSGLSREDFYENYFFVNRPVILTDLTDNWTGFDTWSLDYFKEMLGHIPVEIMFLEREKFTAGEGYGRKELSFGEYVQMVEDAMDPEKAKEKDAFYLTAYNTPKHGALIDGLLKDIEIFPEYLNPEPVLGEVSMWFGPSGTKAQLHLDVANGMLTQVWGTKTVRLIPSWQQPYVYQNSDTFSPVDLDNIDFKSYPAMANAKPIEIELKPRDVLFIPIGWWHQVVAQDLSLSISFTNFLVENKYDPFSKVFRQFV